MAVMAGAFAAILVVLALAAPGLSGINYAINAVVVIAITVITLLFAFMSVLVLFSLSLTVAAQTGRDRSTRKMRAAANQSAKAARVFDQIMNTREKSIPRDLLDRAEAVAVFPSVFKAGLIVGGRGGSGVISRRVAGGWSAPAFFDLGGGSIGLQIGASSTDYILLFMNDDAVGSLLSGCLRRRGRADAVPRVLRQM